VVTFDLKYINVTIIQLSGEPKSLVLLSAVRFLSLGLNITEENMILAICEACVPEFMEETKKNLEEFIRNESRKSESEIDSMLEKVLDTNSVPSSRNSETPTPNLADFIENIQTSIENFKEEISNIHSHSPGVNALPPSPNKSSKKRLKKKRGSSNHNIRSSESPIPRLAHSKSHEKLSTFKDSKYSKHSKHHTCQSKQELMQFSKLMQDRFTVPKGSRSPERKEKVDKIALSDIYKGSGQEENLLSCCLLDGDISDLNDKLILDFESKEEEKQRQGRNMVSREISNNIYEMRTKPIVNIGLLKDSKKNSIRIIDLVLNSERKKSDPLSASWDFYKPEEEETDFQQGCLTDDHEPPNGIKLIDLFIRRGKSEISFSSENSSEENSKIEAAEPETVEIEEVLRIPDAGKLKLYTVIEEGSGNLSQIGGSSDDIIKITNLVSEKHAFNHINSCLSEEDSIESSDDSIQDDCSFTDRSIEDFSDEILMPTVMESPVRISLTPESPILKSCGRPKEPGFNSLDIESPIIISNNSRPAQMHEAPLSSTEIILNIETPNDTTQNSSQGPKVASSMKISCEEGKECGCSQCVIF
jgi:hypothetical protein